MESSVSFNVSLAALFCSLTLLLRVCRGCLATSLVTAFLPLAPLVVGAARGLGKLVIPMRRRAQIYRDRRHLRADLIKSLEGLVAGVKAGLQLSEALEFVRKRGVSNALVQDVLERISQGRALGLGLQESLAQTQTLLAGPTESLQALARFVALLQLGSACGGSSLELLEAHKERLSASLKLARILRVQTAQVRFQALCLSLSPVVIFTGLVVLSDTQARFFFHTTQGHVCLVVMLVLELCAAFFMRRIGNRALRGPI